MESIREKDQLLSQRGVLLHEVNHRTKNSIAMAMAMLRLQIGRQLTELWQNFGHLRSPQVHRIELGTDADDTTLDVDRAINVALIAGEAITNALKHAFPDRQRGAIHVGLHQEADAVLLLIEDNGIGLSVERRAGSMGMRLIEGMARSLNGILSVEGNDGTRIEVRFPVPTKP